MGKWAKYTKNHNKEWEHEPLFKGWLMGKTSSGVGNRIISYCKVCCVELRSHKGDLLKHAGTSKHKINVTKVDKSQQSIRNFGVKITESRKRKEIILATYIASHTTIRNVDHLGEVVNIINLKNPMPVAGSSSASHTEGDSLKIHRTKCSALITNVISPSLMSDLVKDLGDSPFSIIVDESTDVSTEKLLCICIKYYSERKNDIVTQFLTFLSVPQATADIMFEVIIVEFFKSINIDLKNLIGIGTDGANSLCGKNHSLFILLKTNLKLNNLVLVKCICHSLHLCGSKASEVFKDEVDFLLKETYNWFKNSALRMAKYKEIFKLININEDSKFAKFTQLSTTRWLSRYKAVEKILSQYLELQTFFSINYVTERCHTAKILYETYQNKENKLLLHFLLPHLKQIYALNLYFQKNDVDHFKACVDIQSLIWSLIRQILKPALIEYIDFDTLDNVLKDEKNYLKLDDCDFGYVFEKELEAAQLPSEQVVSLKLKCLDFIKVLIQELLKRMPSHLDVFGKVQYFSPNVILNHKRPKFTELPLQFANENAITELEIQYRNLLTVNWANIFGESIPDNPITFWKKVKTLKNAASELLYHELSLFAFKMLILPSSNAAVERVFSVMNVVKTKIRNRMMLKLLNSILCIKYHFYANNICCTKFEPSKDMLSLFTSKMYEKGEEFNTVELECDTEDTDIEVMKICEEYF